MAAKAAKVAKPVDESGMTEKQKALQTAIAQIEKQFGQGAVCLLYTSRCV